MHVFQVSKVKTSKQHVYNPLSFDTRPWPKRSRLFFWNDDREKRKRWYSLVSDLKKRKGSKRKKRKRDFKTKLAKTVVFNFSKTKISENQQNIFFENELNIETVRTKKKSMIATQNSGKQHLENQKLWKSTPKIISEKEKYEIVPKRILEKEFLKNRTMKNFENKGSGLKTTFEKKESEKTRRNDTKKKVTRKKLAEMAQKKSQERKSQESGDPENKQIWNPESLGSGTSESLTSWNTHPKFFWKKKNLKTRRDEKESENKEKWQQIICQHKKKVSPRQHRISETSNLNTKSSFVHVF